MKEWEELDRAIKAFVAAWKQGPPWTWAERFVWWAAERLPRSNQPH